MKPDSIAVDAVEVLRQLELMANGATLEACAGYLRTALVLARGILLRQKPAGPFILESEQLLAALAHHDFATAVRVIHDRLLYGLYKQEGEPVEGTHPD
jgi:hypothetical protein